MSRSLYIVDGHSHIFRAYHAVGYLSTSRGVPSHAVLILSTMLWKLIREERPDVVHLHSRRGSDVWGAVAARLEGVPAVLSRRVDNPESRMWVAIKYRLYDRVIGI